MERDGGGNLLPFLVAKKSNKRELHLSWGVLEDSYRERCTQLLSYKMSELDLETREGSIDSQRFSLHMEKQVVKLACHSAHFSSLLQIRQKLRLKMKKLIMQTHLE